MPVVGSDIRMKWLIMHWHIFVAMSVRTDCVAAAYGEELQEKCTKK